MGTSLWALTSSLPLIIVYSIGLYMAFSRRTIQPQAATLAAWAFAIMLGEIIAGSLLTSWLINSMNSGGQVDSVSGVWLLQVVNVVRVLLHTLAIALLLRALFPALPGVTPPNWLQYALGIIAGLLIGGVLAMLLGDLIGEMLGISTFEGGRGYFVVFIVIPGFALLGALLGALTVGIWARR